MQTAAVASNEIEFRQPVHIDIIIFIGVRVQGRAAGRNGAVDGVRTVFIAPHGHGPPMLTCLRNPTDPPPIHASVSREGSQGRRGLPSLSTDVLARKWYASYFLKKKDSLTVM